MKYTPREAARIVKAAERYVKADTRLKASLLNGQFGVAPAEWKQLNTDLDTTDKALIQTLIRIWGTRKPALGKRAGRKA